MYKIKNFLNIIILFICLGLVPVATIRAAQFVLSSQTTNIKTGDSFEAVLVVDTFEKNINAFGGKIVFPGDLLRAIEIRNGNSIVSLWTEKPRVTDAGDGINKELIFSGIVPGGFSGHDGRLFSVIFNGLADGKSEIKIADAQALLNDGLGSPDDVSFNKNLILRIGSGIAATVAPEKDYIPPEPFSPQIIQDANLFAGRYALIFSATDKESGINHYEIKEAVPGESAGWIAESSPYELRDQGLTSDIYVRAVDNGGNSFVAKVPARFAKKGIFRFGWQIVLVTSGIFIVLLLSTWFIVKRKLRFWAR